MSDAASRTNWGVMRGMIARVAVLGVGLALAGCQTDGTGMAGTSSAGGRALAFESIDGPPKDTFDRLVTRLSSEADMKQVPVVSRTQTAAYRVRGYLSVHTERGRTLVAYAWDVFDADKQRVARITGEETARSVKGSAWAVCDEQMLARIADTTIVSLSETLGVGSSTGAAPATAPAAAGPAEPAQPVAASPAASPAAPAEAPAGTPAPAPAPIDAGGVPVAEAEPSAPSAALAFAAR